MRRFRRLTGAPIDARGNESRLWSIDMAADGSIAHAPGGDVRLAIGGQHRNENFVEGFAAFAGQLERNISAAYGEVRVPWVGAQNRRAGLERLELTVAGRYEDYSDFGTTFNPKLGLSWGPTSGVNVRGTWGTSFKAPLLSQINPADRDVVVYEGYFLDASGTTPTILLQGAGVNLGPEESQNWTAGFDLAPLSVPGLEFSSTYFDIEYDDRIRTPLPSGYSLPVVLMDPTYGVIVSRNPDPDYAAELLGDPRALCFTSDWAACPSMLSADQITAVVDHRLRNLAGVRVSGIDFSMHYRWTSRLGDWSLNLSGTHLLNSHEQLVPGTPPTEQMNTVWRPADLRLRNSLSFMRGALSAVAFLNYTDGYRDDRDVAVTGPLKRDTVASWTTVDLTLQYDLRAMIAMPAIDGMRQTLTAVNIFDRAPPYIASLEGIYFDGVNSSPLGRFLGAQLTLNW